MSSTGTPLPDALLDRLIFRKLRDVFIRLGLLACMLVASYEILEPFARPLLWSTIVAVALYPLHAPIARGFGGRDGWAAVVLVLFVLLGLLVPTTMLAISFADWTTDIVARIRSGRLEIPAPNRALADWPVIGDRLYAAWSAAHSDLGGVIARFEPRMESLTKALLGYAGSVTTAMLKFLAALLLSGVWMAYAVPAEAAARAVASRLFIDRRGDALVDTAIATIRAVGQGVVGIAVIQAVLLGVGFVLAGIPAAGVLALLVLLLGVAQIPALLVSVPAIVYEFATGDSFTVATIFAIYSVFAGAIDGILKPLILARGAGAPMPVILLGALGGLATEGVIGLFLGAVTLALVYRLIVAWVYSEDGDSAATDGTGARTPEPS